MNRNPSAKRGFTLVEVVIATMVVGVGIAGVMSMVFWMVRANGWSGNLTGASTLGQDKIEELLVAPYDLLSDGSDQVDHFSRTWSIGTPLLGDYKTIDLEVAWTRPNGAVSRVVLTSMRSNPAVPGASLGGLGLGTSP